MDWGNYRSVAGLDLIAGPEKVSGDDDDQFRNLLCAQISKVVGLVTIRDVKPFDLTFVDGSGISISLRPENYVGPEAVALNGDSYTLTL